MPQSGNIPNTAPDHSLGYGVLAWCEKYIRQPDGENAGEPWRFTNEQIKLILWLYAVDDNGKWVYRTASLRRSKGWGKSPLLAALCIAEFAGPVRFSHWGQQGQPVGKPEYSPWIQIAATSLDQTANTLTMVRGMLAESPLVAEIGLDIGKTMVQYKGGKPGVIEPVTANSTTLEGGRPTFVVMDETHLWQETNGGHRMFEVLQRNLGKNTGGRARGIDSTNAFNPNQDSVAQRTYEAVQKGSADILYDCVEAKHVPDLKDEADLRRGLKESYGDSVWIDIDRLVAEIYDPRTPAGVSYRFYLNNIQESAETWIAKHYWEACKDEDDPIVEKDQIAIGFDGSLYDDSTALIGCRLRDGKLFVLGLWESDGTPDWEVPLSSVDAAVAKAFKDYRVAWMYCDPYLWNDSIDRWANEFGNKTVFRFATNRERPMSEAIERFHTGVVTGQLKHDGNRNLQRHVLNAVTREVRVGYMISKERPMSKKKIDAAVAAVLAYEARGDAIEDGRMRKRFGRIVTM